MLNYIKAELWKVLHRRGVYVLLALLLLCTALFFMLYSYGGFSSLAKGDFGHHGGGHAGRAPAGATCGWRHGGYLEK